MKIYSFLSLFVGLMFPLLLAAQNKRDIKAEDSPDFFVQKKLRYGLAWHNSWSSLVGSNLPADYFYKPSLGFKFQADYYFNPNWGLNVGVAYQQRGAGILSPDEVKEVGNADSTYRLRLRINSFELPVLLLWRQAKPTIGGTRFTVGFGAVPALIARTGTIFNSVEDGFHILENVSPLYKRFDMLAQAQAGFDINAAGACLLQVQLFYQQGFINAYKSPTFANAKGYSSNWGIKLGFMF